MARRKKTATRTIVRTVSAPKAPTIRIAAPAAISRVGRHVRRHSRRARAGLGRLVGSSQPQLMAILGAAGLGLAQKQGIKIPKLIDSLSTPANAGLIAFGLAKLFKSPTLDHIATGALCVATWAWSSDTTVSGDVLGGYGTGVVYGDEDYSYYEYPQQ